MGRGKLSAIVLSGALLLCLSACGDNFFNKSEENLSSGDFDQSAVALGGLEMDDEEIVALAKRLTAKGYEAFWWYMGTGEGLRVAGSSSGDPVRPVGKFRSTAELKNATEDVFTWRFCDTILFPVGFGEERGSSPKFQDIDGALHMNLYYEGLEPFGELTGEITVVEKKEDRIVVGIVAELADNIQKEYIFEMQLENGVWKLDNWFDYVTDRIPSMDERALEPRYTQYLDLAADGGLLGGSWVAPDVLPGMLLEQFYEAAYLGDGQNGDEFAQMQVPTEDVLRGFRQYFIDFPDEGLKKLSGYEPGESWISFRVSGLTRKARLDSAWNVDGDLSLRYTLLDEGEEVGNGTLLVREKEQGAAYLSCQYTAENVAFLLTPPGSVVSETEHRTCVMENPAQSQRLREYYDFVLSSLKDLRGSWEQQEERWLWQGSYEVEETGWTGQPLAVDIRQNTEQDGCIIEIKY